ncbi:MAG: efflux RND transporter periplasmic adaptor subunit [Planctomycetota bacterium]|nr:efflux RND transporter periplasmic adaptor subunit [Planctomycetota bacterium]
MIASLHQRRALAAFALTPLLWFATGCSDHAEEPGHLSGPNGGELHHDEDGNEHGDEHADDHDEADHDEAGHVEGELDLTPTQLKAIGVVTTTVGPGTLAERLTLRAAVVDNLDTISHVTAKAPGIVRSASGRLGDQVAAGDVLCVIDSAELGREISAHYSARSQADATEGTIALERELYAERIATTEAVLQGAIDLEKRLFEREQSLQAKGVSTLRSLMEAERALAMAEFEKRQGLADLKGERDKRMLELAVQLEEQRIAAEAAHGRLHALGLDADELDETDLDAPIASGTYPIAAAQSGILMDRSISVGQFVDAQTRLYTIEDLSRVWVLASAFEGQLRHVRTGQPVTVKLDAFPGRGFPAKVSRIDYEVDRATRTLGVRVELDNPQIEEWPERFPLRPGMYGSIDVTVSEREVALLLPESALVHEDSGDYVFVRRSEHEFLRRDVQVRATGGPNVEVLSGLEAGDVVVTSGTFKLKSMLRAGELGGGHSH